MLLLLLLFLLLLLVALSILLLFLLPLLPLLLLAMVVGDPGNRFGAAWRWLIHPCMIPHQLCCSPQLLLPSARACTALSLTYMTCYFSP